MQTVDRPTHHGHGGARSALYLAVEDTVESGKALKVPVNGHAINSLRANACKAFRARGLQFHLSYRKGHDYFVCWATKLTR